MDIVIGVGIGGGFGRKGGHKGGDGGGRCPRRASGWQLQAQLRANIGGTTRWAPTTFRRPRTLASRSG